MRDGPKCLLTKYPFHGSGRVRVECTHIIPFSVHDKVIHVQFNYTVFHFFFQTITVAAIEAFSGKVLPAMFIKDHINTPKNALNLQADAHTTMDHNLSWGIEARWVEDKVNWLTFCNF